MTACAAACWATVTKRENLQNHGEKHQRPNRHATHILFRFHKYITMNRTLGNFVVEKPQKTIFHGRYISTHLPVCENSTRIYIDLY